MPKQERNDNQFRNRTKDPPHLFLSPNAKRKDILIWLSIAVNHLMPRRLKIIIKWQEAKRLMDLHNTPLYKKSRFEMYNGNKDFGKPPFKTIGRIKTEQS